MRTDMMTTDRLDTFGRVSGATLLASFVILALAAAGLGYSQSGLLLGLFVVLLLIATAFSVSRHLLSGRHPDNSDSVRSSVLSRGIVGWLFGVVLTVFYVILYWFPHLLGGMVALFDLPSNLLRGKDADQWFMYGTFYTLAVVLMGIRAMARYRGSRYHVIRTMSVMFFQLILAFIVPSILVLFRKPELYFSYFWPLDYDLLWPSSVEQLTQEGFLGAFALTWGIILTFVATPILTYFFGKRWYCSWVCGCGGLAETAGDPFRHLSDKRLVAWKIERWMIHGVLLLIVATTLLLWLNTWAGGAVLGSVSSGFTQFYGFYIGAIFSGVIGVGFYPLMGARVWCRFGCPMAAILGIQQRFFSRFRITTNGGQCISCGNCSKYCEMGIDVRWYAQRGQNIVRASCVGCGVCATVCPRGVLKLENGPGDGRFGDGFVARDSVEILRPGD